jgi:hypothetical protein
MDNSVGIRPGRKRDNTDAWPTFGLSVVVLSVSTPRLVLSLSLCSDTVCGVVGIGGGSLHRGPSTGCLPTFDASSATLKGFVKATTPF